ncbi:hypothetical protein LUZ60_004577 [Juncus effusus]|nr:hypothetical protein LUZ60_004577 [Juncus effusus]
MEVKSSTFLQPSVIPSSTEKNPSEEKEQEQDLFRSATFNLKETSDFVNTLPMEASTSVQRRREENDTTTNPYGTKKLEGPGTPGRPIFFSFSPGHLYRKNVPSKWEDAEKWLVGTGSCNNSPVHGVKTQEPLKSSRLSGGLEKKGGANKAFVEKPVLRAQNEVFLKDKFTENTEQQQDTEPLNETFIFKNEISVPTKLEVINKRDIGTEMTPLGSSKTSRCPTPIISTSPVRHNTPEGRSGPLVPYNSNAPQFKDFNFVQFESNWSSKAEEEEEVSKSLRHFEMSCESDFSGENKRVDSRVCLWEEEERTKSCIRYQREEAKIQAWVNLESAKAEAQSRKLEVKIQKMRSNLEEKLMKRMANVQRKAEEWRAASQLQHLQQLQKASQNAQKIKSSYFSSNNKTCGCFSCNNTLV